MQITECRKPQSERENVHWSWMVAGLPAIAHLPRHTAAAYAKLHTTYIALGHAFC